MQARGAVWVWFLLFINVTCVQAAGGAEGSALRGLCAQVQGRLAEGLGEAADMAKLLFGRPLDGDEAREIVAEWESGALPGAHLAFVDQRGAVIPTEGLPGLRVSSGVSSNRLWKQMLEKEEPVAGMMPAGEGGESFCQSLCPLYDGEGRVEGAVCLVFPVGEVVNSCAEESGLNAEEVFYVLDARGRVVYERGDGRVRVGESAGAWREEGSGESVVDRMLGEDEGRAVCVVPGAVEGGTGRGEVEWVACRFLDMPWVLVRERPLERPVREGGGPLTGRWVGAYTYSDRTREGAEKKAGQLNVEIRQEGRACTLTALGTAGEIHADGVFVHDEISAAQVRLGMGGKMEIWYWQGHYDPEKDAIRGTIYGNAADEAVTQSYYLRRVGGEGL